MMRNITRWMLDTEVRVFHECISYFMKWPWNCISWNAQKEKIHSVYFPQDRFYISFDLLKNESHNYSFVVIKYLFWNELTFSFLWCNNDERFIRSSRSQMFWKRRVLKYFAIFTGKHLCWSLFLIKLHPWMASTLLKRDSNTGVFL